MPKVSVIVPIYGVEKYIERCARSLFEQTLEDIEFIFVDDCTPDNSMVILNAIIREYPEHKKNITILHHKENKGLPRTRQTGLTVARGDYIAHCDSDDWVERDMYRLMYEAAFNEQAEMVVCDFNITDGCDVHRYFKGCHDTSLNKYIVNCLFQKDRWSLCNKLFKRATYYKDLRCPIGNMGEDMALTCQLLQRCHKIAYVEQSLYNYYSNPNSITQKLTLKSVLNNFHAVKGNTDIVLELYRNTTDKEIRHGLLFLQYNAKAHLFPVVHIRKYRKEFNRTYPNLLCQIFFCRTIPLVCKLKYICSLMGMYPKKVNE